MFFFGGRRKTGAFSDDPADGLPSEFGGGGEEWLCENVCGAGPMQWTVDVPCKCVCCVYMCAKILLRFAEECVAFYFPSWSFVSDVVSRMIPFFWSKSVNISDL